MLVKAALLSLLQASALAVPAASDGTFVRSRQPSDGLPTRESLRKLCLSQGRACCEVMPDPNGGDDAPAIAAAFKKCKTKGFISLPGATYNIKSNMTTRGLKDVHIHQLGRMLWSTDIDYWLSVSMPIGFQNQSTVWYFGGDGVVWDGYNTGTLDGNGQVWYDWAKSEGNLPRRPMNINFDKLTNSSVKRMRFVQSQMWTMAITNSKNVQMDDIYVSSVSNSKWNTLNTDGCDTIWSDSITFRRWYVRNGDDAIATKMDSSNIRVYDSVFEDGQGVAIGSLAQYDKRYDFVRGFYARNITLRNTAHVSYIKTWAGVSRGYPPNGGGGGVGEAKDIVMENIVIERLRQQPFFSWQCENYSGWAGKDCNSSKFKISNVAWRNVRGTVINDVKEAGSFQCSSAAGGCDNIEATNIDIKNVRGDVLDKYKCENVHSPKGFTCSPL
ncbi:glycoside hydrolase family 28 [Purpureocillium lilacinum]|nr:glycoside hydrolase family 28 [Purpureocillium lilacinum]OAQ75138.1 glycoside hydrolase family 28 [Purpureocillium lilacinum]OAQ80766.1 glycoside hydrolase family 28 [Purpureocillium lilacinum]GJN76460.1 hypothetical protein PLICBS_010573 [Purpureocillium lilacinum]GJN86344.1 hypothetical protein PLIIFM63780_009924 [Purpureocillium lilacinum]